MSGNFKLHSWLSSFFPLNNFSIKHSIKKLSARLLNWSSMLLHGIKWHKIIKGQIFGKIYGLKWFPRSICLLGCMQLLPTLETMQSISTSNIKLFFRYLDWNLHLLQMSKFYCGIMQIQLFCIACLFDLNRNLPTFNVTQFCFQYVAFAIQSKSQHLRYTNI